MSGESNTYDSTGRSEQLIQLAKALPGFDIAGTMDRLDGNISTFKELLPSFYQYLDAALSELRPLIRDGGNEEALIRLHGLKGISGNLGAISLKRVFEEMEKALATAQENEYEMLITHMEQTIRQNLVNVEAVLEADASPSPETPPPDAAGEDLLAGTMDLLGSLLDQQRLDAIDAFQGLKRLLKNRQPPDPAFDNLAAAMKRLDFAKAREALTVLAASLKIVL